MRTSWTKAMWAALAALCLVAATGSPAHGATIKGETYAPDLLPRRGVDFLGGRQFSSLFKAFPWEIKGTFKHADGHLGRFKVGETILVSFTVGLAGQRTSANTKNFPAPVAKVYILAKGKVKEVLDMKRGAC